MKNKKIAILGAGNIGTAIASGLADSGAFRPDRMILTRKHPDRAGRETSERFRVISDNREAVRNTDVVILCVEPHQASDVMRETAGDFNENKLLISVVSGLKLAELRRIIGNGPAIVRSMPNTAIAIRESMTCLTAENRSEPGLKTAEIIFSAVGETIVIDEDRMGAATALAACGIAFFLRAVRAASQGGIEAGFHAGDALRIAAQTARGAASLLKVFGNHPEQEIDKVTTPLGCTISGLNQMEHDGFSSAMIKGIRVSAEKAYKLYSGGGEE